MTREKSASLVSRYPFKRLVGAVLILIAVVIVVTIWSWSRLTPTAPSGSAPVSVDVVEERELILYFATDTGLLVGEARMLPETEDAAENLRSVVTALISGPVNTDLLRVLPENTRLLNLEIQESTALLDFSREFIAAHPGGSVSELLTVYALVDTLAVNFPYVRQIRIQVEGQDIETIKGHADLRRSIAVDFSYIDGTVETEDKAHGDAVGDLIEKHGSGETQQ